MTIGGVFLGEFRELTGKDIYYIEILKKENGDEDVPETSFLLELISHLSECEMDTVLEMKVKHFRALCKWFAENILEGRVMTAYQFLEICFHLMKQRWDASLDWLEDQPMSKVLTMIQILSKFNENQSSEMKKASRRK